METRGAILDSTPAIWNWELSQKLGVCKHYSESEQLYIFVNE